MKNNIKTVKGITLISLIITIIVLIILASIFTYSGISIIKSSRLTTFTTELKIMQTEINSLYDKYKNGETIKVGADEYTGDAILTMRKESTDSSISTDIDNSSLPAYAQAEKVFTANESGIENKDGYLYFNKKIIEDLHIEGVDQEFFVNIEKRSVVSYEGFKYEGKVYYTLDQLPNSVYNVEYNNPNSGKPTFDASIEEIGDNKWRITISNIQYTEGYIDKWQVVYQAQGWTYWNTIEDMSFVVDTPGKYKLKIKNEEIESDMKFISTSLLPLTEDTEPFLPDGATVINKDLSTGVVIKDSNGNEWVWVEVPRSIYTDTTYNGGTAPTSSEDYEKIESVMQAYASAYRSSTYTDTWNSEAQHGFASSDDYNNYKNTMLKSVYENGGFYIGRYEVGTETARTSSSDELSTPIIQQNAYPYNYVTCKQAQGLANRLATGGRTSSLMFGIQWDLVMKFIEDKRGKTYDELKLNSTTWGNYYNTEFDIEKGKYSEDYGGTFTDVASSYTKPNNTSVLLTTGATERNSTLNIYDLAGNVFEWTLEYTAATVDTCSIRGGLYSYHAGGDVWPASSRSLNSTTDSDSYFGFRPTLYGDVVEKETLPTTESYAGYYADLNNDGQITLADDGIIYADLAVGKSGTWNNDDWNSYSYDAVTSGLNEYIIISETSEVDPLKTEKGIIQLSQENATDRFHVMALQDINPGTSYCWYDAAYGKLDKTVATGDNDFGQGRANSEYVMAKWDDASLPWGAHNDNGTYLDLWGVIKDKYEEGWFVPSKAEWSAFGDYLYTNCGLTTSNYSTYGLSDWYWSSSQCNPFDAYGADVGNGFISNNYVNYSIYVRLSATF